MPFVAVSLQILLQTFYRNVPWVVRYATREFCPNLWIWFVAIATNTLTLKKKIFPQKPSGGWSWKFTEMFIINSLYKTCVSHCRSSKSINEKRVPTFQGYLMIMFVYYYYWLYYYYYYYYNYYYYHYYNCCCYAIVGMAAQSFPLANNRKS